jgi:hypothetical protein
MVGIAHRWPAPVGVGRVLAKVGWEWGIRQTLNTPVQTSGGVRSRRGQPSKEIFEPDQKLLPALLNFEKNIALAFLKVA